MAEGEKVDGELWLNTLLDASDAERFFAVQSYYGMRNRTEVVRFLIRKEARELGLTLPLFDEVPVVAGD